MDVVAAEGDEFSFAFAENRECPESGMMSVAEPVVRPPAPQQRLPLALTVHTISAVTRPISFSRITNSRIINDPPFRSG